MPSKLRRAIGAVKDQTSIGLAKIGRSADLDVAILRATSHDEVPINERHASEVLLHLLSSPSSASSALVHALSRRISRTSNWVVALKSLALAFRVLRDGGPNFPIEVLASAHLFDLSSFRFNSDFTAFVRTFALYLQSRLDAGKLHRTRLSVTTMKPIIILDRISQYQRLLDRAIRTRPTGAATHNRLIQITLYSVIRESFELYRYVSDGLSMLLDNFFHLQYYACLETFRACTRAAKQFEELDAFYGHCKRLGVGRMTEYPSVQKISTALLDTLKDFLKDHEASSMSHRRPPLSRRSSEWGSTTSDQNWVSAAQTFRASSSGNNDLESASVSELAVLDEKRKGSTASCLDGWELVLVETAKSSSSSVEGLWGRSSSYRIPQNYSNPFLHYSNERSLSLPSKNNEEGVPLDEERTLAKANEERTPTPALTEAKTAERAPYSSLREAWIDEGRTLSPTFPAVKPDERPSYLSLHAAWINEERTLPPTFQPVKTDERPPCTSLRAAWINEARTPGQQFQPANPNEERTFHDTFPVERRTSSAFKAAKPNEDRTPPTTFQIAKTNGEIASPSTFQEVKPDVWRTSSPTFKPVKSNEERIIPLPTFRAGDPGEAMAMQERDPFASHDHTGSSLVQASNESARQQLLLREQLMWLQQQSKIIAKNLGR